MASAESSPTIIFIWTVPRTCSTALTKCLTFVEDAEVWLEPFNASFYNETLFNPEFRKGDPNMDGLRGALAEMETTGEKKALRREMAEQIRTSPNLIDQEEISYSWTKNQLKTPKPEVKYVIVKDQSYATVDHLDYFPDLTKCRHVFLIRHPREVYVSFKELVWKRVGIAKSWESVDLVTSIPHVPADNLFQIHNRFWKDLQKKSEFEPVVIDAYDYTSTPEKIIPKLFHKSGIPFKQRYLEWEEGEEVIAKKWKGSADAVLLETKTIMFSRAAKSSHFEAPKQPRGTPANQELEITPELKVLIDNAMPFYEEMYAQRLQ